MEDKIDKILETVTCLNTDVKLIQQEIKTMNERGCELSVKAIAKMNERINSNDKEHNFIKGVAYAGGLVGSIIGYLLSYFNSKQ